VESAGHREGDLQRVRCAILTVSDTSGEASDTSGQCIRELIEEAGHEIAWYGIVRDEPDAIRQRLCDISAQRSADVIIANGGTGITPRDRTSDVVKQLIERELPGFGELFRMLSFQQIGAAAMLSRATAGVTRSGVVIFALPGSEKAVRLAVSGLIAPALGHMVGLIRK